MKSWIFIDLSNFYCVADKKLSVVCHKNFKGCSYRVCTYVVYWYHFRDHLRNNERVRALDIFVEFGTGGPRNSLMIGGKKSPRILKSANFGE